MGRVTANGRPDEASDLLALRGASASGLFAGRTRRSYSPSIFLLRDDLIFDLVIGRLRDSLLLRRLEGGPANDEDV